MIFGASIAVYNRVSLNIAAKLIRLSKTAETAIGLLVSWPNKQLTETEQKVKSKKFEKLKLSSFRESEVLNRI